jgi:hypothetical protein
MTYSQVGQDLFVLKTLNNKKNGYYIEIGGNHPDYINNTFLLEKEFLWNGFSLEIDKKLVEAYNKVRRNICIEADAIKFDYLKFLKKNNYPSQIDYLSLDIEPPEQTFQCLLKLPLEKYRFSVITYEHEYYYAGSKYRDSAREYLKKFNYKLAASDVKCPNGNIFEDWYIDNSVTFDT